MCVSVYVPSWVPSLDDTTFFFLPSYAFSLSYVPSSALQLSEFPCSDRYEGILTEREGNVNRGSKRKGDRESERERDK